MILLMEVQVFERDTILDLNYITELFLLLCLIE